MLKDKRVSDVITDTKDVKILVDYAKANIEAGKQIEKANDWASQHEFDTKLVTGKLEFTEVVDRFKEGKLSSKGLKKFTKLAGGVDTLDVKTDYILFNKLFMDIHNPDKDLEKTYIKTNEAFVNDKIATEDYKVLLEQITPDYKTAVNKNRY